MATLCSRVANMTARCLYQVGEVIRQPLLSTHTSQVTSVRTRYADWRMLRDVKRRRLVKEMGRERRNINLIRKNDILPTELQVPFPVPVLVKKSGFYSYNSEDVFYSHLLRSGIRWMGPASGNWNKSVLERFFFCRIRNLKTSDQSEFFTQLHRTFSCFFYSGFQVTN
ncbi:uncharacterized protein LOC117103069 isoform X1 [Anneissia japonica]|uniref:uncharacterized protein LOC117103069 isoform X1 n=1 Tax=Anneissia japonica TaxID=1529436 RepID=UPI00142587CC|nr:uncharacterized protein LOC117103069 isoform X1 [Anneissia japonica]